MFTNRSEAGRHLAALVAQSLPSAPPVVVLGLPRGGVPVAYEVALALGVPLDVIVVRKLGVPYQPELAMGAIGEDGVRVVNHEVTRRAGVSAAQLEAVEEHERAELARRAVRFRGEHDRVPLAGRTALIVDDGIATDRSRRVPGRTGPRCCARDRRCPGRPAERHASAPPGGR
jgi:putative phosphoribosyl transferase